MRSAPNARSRLDGPASEEGRVGGTARELFLDMNGRALRAAPVGEEVEPRSAIERIGQLTMPVHVVTGRRDTDDSIERAHQLVDQVEVGTLTEFDDAAHLPQLENPEACANDLRAFFERVPKGG